MSYKKTPAEQLRIVRQSSLERATQLYIAGHIDAGKLEQTAENFVKWIYNKLGVLVGGYLTDAQIGGIIVLQSTLHRTVEMALAGKIDVLDIFTAAEPLSKYIYEGCNAKC